LTQNNFLSKFKAKYAPKGKEYMGHFTPAGAKVVIANEFGHREVNGWKFYYNGWIPDDFNCKTFIRGNSTREYIKSNDRKGRLDAALLKAHGLTSERMACDSFIFLQLLLPVCDPRRSGIIDDGRMPFFCTVTLHTNGYVVMEKGWGGGYGHGYKLVAEQELVRWVGVPIHHEARDGSASSLHRRWMVEDADFDHVIADSMKISR